MIRKGDVIEDPVTGEMPNLLRLSMIANAHFEDVRLPFPPAWVQMAGLLVGAPLGRRLDYEPQYDDGAEVIALAV